MNCPLFSWIFSVILIVSFLYNLPSTSYRYYFLFNHSSPLFFRMYIVKLRDSLLEKLRDPGLIYTQNCLESLSAALTSLTVHNHVLETILLSSRRSIAQYVHLFTHVLHEFSSFIEHEYDLRKSSTDDSLSVDPLSTRIRFLNRLEDVHCYVESYLASFRVDYQSLVLCANQFDYHEGSNGSFLDALQACKSLTELDLLVEGHGEILGL